jgi:DNA-binding MarR family transcriptional regulator
VAVAPLVTRWMERLLAGRDEALTVAQYLALRALDRERTTAGELARRTGVSGAAVSQLVAQLEGAGLVKREPVEGDRRSRRLALSAAGRAAFRSADAVLRERIGGLLADLPRPEADALGRALPDVEAVLSDTPPPRRGPRHRRHPKPPRSS